MPILGSQFWRELFKDFTLVNEVGVWKQWGIVGTPLNIVVDSNSKITFFGCNNGTSYCYQDKGVDYFTDFTHWLDITQETGEVGTKVFPWMLSNNLGDTKTLKDSNYSLIAVKIETYSGPTHKICLYETNSGTEYSSAEFIHDTSKRYLAITKSGTSLTLKVYGSKDDRLNDENVLSSQSLTLQEDYSFRYIFIGNSWFVSPSHGVIIKVIIEDLQYLIY